MVFDLFILIMLLKFNLLVIILVYLFLGKVILVLVVIELLRKIIFLFVYFDIDLFLDKLGVVNMFVVVKFIVNKRSKDKIIFFIIFYF